MRKIVLYSFCLLGVLGISQGQKMDYSLTQKVIFDDREYEGRFRPLNRIIFGSLTRGNVHFMNKNNTITLGASSFYNFGSTLEESIFLINANYTYLDTNIIEVKVGTFNRDRFIEDFPLALIEDAYNYFKINIEGIAVRVFNQQNSFLIFYDHRGLLATDRNEAFHIGAKGEYHLNNYYAKLYYSQHHIANTLLDDPDVFRDNIEVGLKLGWEKTFRNSLTIEGSAMYLFGADRNQKIVDNQWIVAHGTELSLNLRHKYFGINTNYYFGDSQSIFLGNPFYGIRETNFFNIPLNYIGYVEYFAFQPFFVFQKEKLNIFVSPTFHFVDNRVPFQGIITVEYSMRGKIK